jgi:hypothetical protein
MNRIEKRKERIDKLAAAINDQKAQDKNKYPMTTDESLPPITKPKSYQDIAQTLRIDIPVCNLTPVNGRIYVIEKPAMETKTPGGIIIERRMNVKKDDKAEGLKRYFVVTWDKIGIPEYISNQLKVGIEVNPWLPQEAEEWSLPRVIDWSTGNEFKSIDFLELAGISTVQPEKDE